jgi:mannose-1-phosphate guanylyltransferase
MKVSFIPVLAEWIGAGGRIGGVVSQGGHWWNLGSRTEYLTVHRTLSEEMWRPDYVQPSAWPIRIAADADVDPSAQVCGCSSVGAGCRIGAGAIVEDSILWPGAEIAPHSRLNRCVVRTGRGAEGSLSDAVI